MKSYAWGSHLLEQNMAVFASHFAQALKPLVFCLVHLPLASWPLSCDVHLQMSSCKLSCDGALGPEPGPTQFTDPCRELSHSPQLSKVAFEGAFEGASVSRRSLELRKQHLSPVPQGKLVLGNS